MNSSQRPPRWSATVSVILVLGVALAGCGTQETGAVQDAVPTSAAPAPEDAGSTSPTPDADVDGEGEATVGGQASPATDTESELPPGYGPDGNEQEEYGEGYDAEGFGPDGNEEELYGEGVDADDTAPSPTSDS